MVKIILFALFAQISITFAMEDDSNKPTVPITHLPESEQVDRLHFLFQNKVLDIFLTSCQAMIETGANLSQLSTKYSLYYDLQQQYNEMLRVMDLTESMLGVAKSGNEGWKSIQIDEKCILSVRTNHTLMEMKSQGTIQCKFTDFLTLVYLVKLYHACVPFCKESIDIMQPTRLEKVGFIRLSIPVPFIKDRSTFIRGVGIDRLQHNGTAVIFAQGINSSTNYLKRYNIDIQKRMKGKELLDVKHFICEIKSTGPTQFTYSAHALVDHHIPLLPESLVAFVAKQFAKYLFLHLMKKLKDFQGSIWAKEKKENYEENKQFYEWLGSKQDYIRQFSHQK